MEYTISPKYLMKLIADIEANLWDLFPRKKYKNVRFYIEKWHKSNINDIGEYSENFTIYEGDAGEIDTIRTLNNIDGETLIKMAIDLGLETPDFIPSIPVFRNVLKSEYTSASATFESSFNKIESEPNIAIGLANSALESIIKEILKDERIACKIKMNSTLYNLTCEILKVFNLFPNSVMPEEIKTIGSSLLAVCQGIERLRSEKTDFHGKTNNDYLITDPMFTYFIVNSVATIGLFLNSFYKYHYPKLIEDFDTTEDDILPF